MNLVSNSEGTEPNANWAASRRNDILPRSLPPIGLSRETAAAYIDVSASKFDQMVADGRMPKPKKIDGRRVWDRSKIERAFAIIPGDDDDMEVDKWAKHG